MPTGKVDYQKGLIYTIRTRDSVYVGSTTNYTKRKNDHKSNINIRQQKLYKTIIENDYEWDMKPYQLFPCNSKLELEIEEERIRKEISADLNMNSCSGVDKEKFQKYHKEYREQHKEQNKQTRKKYRDQHKEHYKEWRDQHKEEIKQYKIKHYQQNKERISEKTKEKITCECGSCVRRCDITRHKRTNKHQLFLEQK